MTDKTVQEVQDNFFKMCFILKNNQLQKSLACPRICLNKHKRRMDTFLLTVHSVCEGSI